MGEKKHINKIPPKIPGQSRENFVYVFFSLCVFSLPNLLLLFWVCFCLLVFVVVYFLMLLCCKVSKRDGTNKSKKTGGPKKWNHFQVKKGGSYVSKCENYGFFFVGLCVCFFIVCMFLQKH